MIDERAAKTRLPGLESVVYGVVQGTLLVLIALTCVAILLLAVGGLLRLWLFVTAVAAAV